MKFFLIILLLTKIMILESLSIRGIQFIDNKTDYFNKKMSLEIETRICIEICSECFDYDESGIKVIVINTVKVSFLARDQARVNFFFVKLFIKIILAYVTVRSRSRAKNKTFTVINNFIKYFLIFFL